MVARYWSFGSHATPLTQPLCSPRILTFLSFTVSNTMAVLSVEQDTRNVEQGDLKVYIIVKTLKNRFLNKKKKLSITWKTIAVRHCSVKPFDLLYLVN
jgi:hypothetical protein